jgi:hypothetical protein
LDVPGWKIRIDQFKDGWPEKEAHKEFDVIELKSRLRRSKNGGSDLDFESSN